MKWNNQRNSIGHFKDNNADLFSFFLSYMYSKYSINCMQKVTNNVKLKKNI